MGKELMGFWKYDVFPYLLCGEIIEFTPKGKIVVKGYDTLIFTPEFILPYEEGLKLKEELESLKKAYDIRTKNLLNEFKKEKDYIISKYK